MGRAVRYHLPREAARTPLTPTAASDRVRAVREVSLPHATHFVGSAFDPSPGCLSFLFFFQKGFRVNLYVGNLSYEVTEDDLRTAFEAYGEVSSASVIMDRATGRSRGFGFIEMPDKNQGQEAIQALNLKELKGRAITVNEARPKTEGSGARSGGFGGRSRY